MNNQNMRIIFLTLLLACHSLLLSTICLSADNSGQIFWGRIGDTMLDRVANPSDGAVQITAANEGSNVALRFGREISTASSEVGKFSAWSLLFSAPFDQNEDLNEVATLDGLANSFSAKFVYNTFRWPGIPAEKQLQDQNLYDEICEEAKYNYLGEGKEEADWVCDTDLVKSYAPKRYNEFRPLVLRPPETSKLNTWRTLWGVSGAVGYEEFDYLDSTTFQQQDSNETPWSVGAHFGFAPPIKDYPVFVTFGYNYQESYKNQSDSIQCPASDGSSTVTCVSGSFGEPNEREKQLGSVEMRGLIQGFGISVKYTHDFENEINGVDVPIYLYRNKSNNLNAGLRFGWIDDTDDVQAGVFVGTGFKLFN